MFHTIIPFVSLFIILYCLRFVPVESICDVKQSAVKLIWPLTVITNQTLVQIAIEYIYIYSNNINMTDKQRNMVKLYHWSKFMSALSRKFLRVSTAERIFFFLPVNEEISNFFFYHNGKPTLLF